MPRQKKIEPLPLETFTYEGIDFEVRDESCWALGRGQHSSLEHYLEREKVIYAGINNVLFKSNDSNELRANGIETVKEIFKSPTSFVNTISKWGIFGETGVDTTDARKEWYPRYKKEIFTILRAYEEKLKVRLPPTSK